MPVSSEAETRYRAVKTRNGLFLRDIRTASQYSFNERDQKDGSVTTYVV